jgi:hypothetical protein
MCRGGGSCRVRTLLCLISIICITKPERRVKPTESVTKHREVLSKCNSCSGEYNTHTVTSPFKSLNTEWVTTLSRDGVVKRGSYRCVCSLPYALS